MSDERIMCLFWNLNKQNRPHLLSDLVEERGVDIVVLAEAGDHAANLQSLRAKDSDFFQPTSRIEKLQIMCRRKTLKLNEVYADVSKRFTMRSIMRDRQEFLLGAVHLVSNRNWGKESQNAEICELARQIRNSESHRGHSRTLLVGDFNMNPFDHGIVQANGFHGVMTKKTALARNRKVQGRDYPFFYNPMWGFFGDRTHGPAGAHYYRSGHVSYDWNMYDQVLVRPDALDCFDDTMEIISSISDTNLLTRQGRPDPKVGSDHLPLAFSLSFSS